MTDVAALTARSPLAALIRSGRHGSAGGAAGVQARVVRDVAMAAVIARNGRGEAVCARLSRWLGATVEDRATRSEWTNKAVIGVSLRQWLVAARGSSGEAEIAALMSHLKDQAAVTAQGDGRVVIEVSGARVRDALCKGIAIDLDPRVFRPGDSAGTLVAHLTVQLSCIEMDRYEIIGAASTAQNLWHWLEASAAEFGLDVTV